MAPARTAGGRLVPADPTDGAAARAVAARNKYCVPELSQHCGETHLRCYLAEFDFRYCNRQANGLNDAARSVRALEGIMGKRLTYQAPDRAGA